MLIHMFVKSLYKHEILIKTQQAHCLETQEKKRDSHTVLLCSILEGNFYTFHQDGASNSPLTVQDKTGIWCPLTSEKRDRHFVGKVPLCLSSHSFPGKQWGFPFPYCSPSYRYIQWNMDCSFSLFLLFILHMLALLVTKDRKTVTDEIFRFTKRVDEHSQYRFTRDNFILSNSIALYVVAHCIHAHSLA